MGGNKREKGGEGIVEEGGTERGEREWERKGRKAEGRGGGMRRDILFFGLQPRHENFLQTEPSLKYSALVCFTHFK